MKITISKIHELTGIDRRAITRRLAPLTPDNQGNVGHFYDSAEALRLVFGVGSGDLDPQQEKALLDRTRRELLEIEVDIRKGNIIPADLVQTHWEKMIANCRAQLLNLPNRLATKTVGAATYQQAEREARDLIHEALHELAKPGVPPQ
jgi:hypothetical protein